MKLVPVIITCACYLLSNKEYASNMNNDGTKGMDNVWILNLDGNILSKLHIIDFLIYYPWSGWILSSRFFPLEIQETRSNWTSSVKNRTLKIQNWKGKLSSLSHLRISTFSPINPLRILSNILIENRTFTVQN
jgi:hypothetical protein